MHVFRLRQLARLGCAPIVNSLHPCTFGLCTHVVVLWGLGLHFSVQRDVHMFQASLHSVSFTLVCRSLGIPCATAIYAYFIALLIVQYGIIMVPLHVIIALFRVLLICMISPLWCNYVYINIPLWCNFVSLLRYLECYYCCI